MDRLEAVSLVLAVADAGSLSAAVRAQKVSRKVSELEAHLKAKLFNRSSRALVPTDAGRSYIADPVEMPDQASRALRRGAAKSTKARSLIGMNRPAV